MNDGISHSVFSNPLGTENPENNIEAFPQSLLDEKQFQNVFFTKDSDANCIPLSTNINLKCKKRMLYFPIDFGELTIDGLSVDDHSDTGELSSAIPEMNLRRKFDFSLCTARYLGRSASKLSNNGCKWTIRDSQEYNRTEI